MQNDALMTTEVHTFDSDTRSFADQFMLWAMRKWVIGHKGAPAALALLQNAFDRTSAPDAVQHLNGLMQAITAGASRRIAVHAPCCTAVSGDELLVLDAIALAQAEVKVDVAFLLRRFLTPAGARAAAAPLRDLAAALRDSGLRLTVRSGTYPLAGVTTLDMVQVPATLH